MTAGRIDRRLYSRTGVRGVDCVSNCSHFITFMKEAANPGSSIARIPKVSYCTSVLFKDTQVGT